MNPAYQNFIRDYLLIPTVETYFKNIMVMWKLVEQIWMLLQVSELEAAVIQLLEASEDCMHFSSAVQSVGNVYQLGEEVPILLSQFTTTFMHNNCLFSNA